MKRLVLLSAITSLFWITASSAQDYRPHSKFGQIIHLDKQQENSNEEIDIMTVDPADDVSRQTQKDHPRPSRPTRTRQLAARKNPEVSNEDNTSRAIETVYGIKVVTITNGEEQEIIKQLIEASVASTLAMAESTRSDP